MTTEQNQPQAASPQPGPAPQGPQGQSQGHRRRRRRRKGQAASNIQGPAKRPGKQPADPAAPIQLLAKSKNLPARVVSSRRMEMEADRTPATVRAEASGARVGKQRVSRYSSGPWTTVTGSRTETWLMPALHDGISRQRQWERQRLLLQRTDSARARGHPDSRRFSDTHLLLHRRLVLPGQDPGDRAQTGHQGRLRQRRQGNSRQAHRTRAKRNGPR